MELTFTETSGGRDLLYTVRRSPRHFRKAKRSGAANQAVPENIDLFMPDGSEYPQKEAAAKLVEITGLTKEQFSQVAMIAQGEFMELLRASSDRKREIFRKLFGTEIFDRIVRILSMPPGKRHRFSRHRARCLPKSGTAACRSRKTGQALTARPAILLRKKNFRSL